MQIYLYTFFLIICIYEALLFLNFFKYINLVLRVNKNLFNLFNKKFFENRNQKKIIFYSKVLLLQCTKVIIIIIIILLILQFLLKENINLVFNFYINLQIILTVLIYHFLRKKIKKL